jgi:hypothetical protein
MSSLSRYILLSSCRHFWGFPPISPNREATKRVHDGLYCVLWFSPFCHGWVVLVVCRLQRSESLAVSRRFVRRCARDVAGRRFLMQSSRVRLNRTL